MRNFLSAALTIVALLSGGAAVAQQVTAMPLANLPLSGAERTYIIQNGVSRQINVGNLVPAVTGQFLPLGGGTMTGPLNGTSANFSGNLVVTGTITGAGGSFLPLAGGTLGAAGAGQITLTPGANTSTAPVISTNSSAGMALNGGTAGVSVVGGGPLVANNGVSIARTLSPAGGALSPLMTWTINPTGTTSTPTAVLWSLNSTDTLAGTSGNQILQLASIAHAIGGASFQGNRTSFQVKMTQTSKTGNLASGLYPFGGSFQPVAFAVQVNASEGGTDTTQTGSYGQFYAGTSVARTLAGATGLHEVANWEADMNTAAPSYKKIGWKVTQLITDVAQGVLDGAYVIENGGTSSNNGWHNGFLAIQPNANFPYATDGTILNAPMASDYATFNTMSAGVDLRDITFTTGPFRARNFLVDPLGTVRVGNGYLAKTTAGASLDTTGSVGPAEGATLSGGAIVTGGTGYSSGVVLYDPYGGVWAPTTTSGGVITVLTCLRTPYFASATPPANPVTLTPWVAVSGIVGGTVTVTMPWTQPNTLSLQPTGGALKVGSGMTIANGSVATVLGALGPVGSHTTVQTWLQVQDSGGVVRYVPAF